MGWTYHAASSGLQFAVSRRNEDYRTVTSHMEFAPQNRRSMEVQGGHKPMSLTTADFVAWMGDLNYRLDTSRQRVSWLLAERGYVTPVLAHGRMYAKWWGVQRGHWAGVKFDNKVFETWQRDRSNR